MKGFAIRPNGATCRAMIMVPRHEAAMCDAILDWSLDLHNAGLLIADEINVFGNEIALRQAAAKDMNFVFRPFIVYRVRPHMRLLLARHGSPVSEDNVSVASSGDRVEEEEEK